MVIETIRTAGPLQVGSRSGILFSCVRLQAFAPGFDGKLERCPDAAALGRGLRSLDKYYRYFTYPAWSCVLAHDVLTVTARVAQGPSQGPIAASISFYLGALPS